MRSKQKQPRSIRSRPYTRSFAKTQINTEINDEKHSDISPYGSVINISQGFEDSFVTQSIDSTYKSREGPTDISQDSLKDKLVENLNNTASTLEIIEKMNMIYIVILPVDMDEIMIEACCNAQYVWGGSIPNVPLSL